MKVTRLLPNICTERMEETRDFYVNLLGFVVGTVHPGWYIQLVSPTDPRRALTIIPILAPMQSEPEWLTLAEAGPACSSPASRRIA